MRNVKYIYWQDGSDWLGYLEGYPDYATQGSSLEDLKEHLTDLYADLTGGEIPGVRHEGELVLA
jgi:predicted RNase H-like HicB family nuclease